MTFDGAKLDRANFRSIKIGLSLYAEVISMQGASLDGADFSNASIENFDFNSASLGNAVFEKARISGANFNEAILFNANFKNVRFGTMIHSTPRDGIWKNEVSKYPLENYIRFKHADVDRANFSGTNMTCEVLAYAVNPEHAITELLI